jgi:hypothetical protein
MMCDLAPSLAHAYKHRTNMVVETTQQESSIPHASLAVFPTSYVAGNTASAEGAV